MEIIFLADNCWLIMQGCPIKISRTVLVSDKQTPVIDAHIPVSNGLRLSTVLEILMGQPWADHEGFLLMDQLLLYNF